MQLYRRATRGQALGHRGGQQRGSTVARPVLSTYAVLSTKLVFVSYPARPSVGAPNSVWLLDETRKRNRIGAMDRPALITLSTDFGVRDGYVGTMKGVMLDIAPDAQLVDITHQVAPQAIHEAAYILYTAYRFFPSRTVHLVVVDPGVGSSRRPIAAQLSHGAFVGPDNGVFSFVMAEEHVETIVELANPRYRLPAVSQTFHGRDIFAPAAAHLAAGVPIEELGPALEDPVLLPPPRLDITSQTAKGVVLHTDHFGNAITSIGRLLWRDGDLCLVPAFRRENEEFARFRASEASVKVAGRELHGLHGTYADVEPGSLVALIGSEGHLEIAVREGSGAKRLDLQPGHPVFLRW